MRKNIVRRESGSQAGAEWLELANMTQVEITSEDPSQPIESALEPFGEPGWRAAETGPQRIRLFFDTPLKLKRIFLLIDENEVPRNQQFVLRWSGDNGRSYHDIVRQQYRFSPPGTTTEQEDYKVDLHGVTALELEIVPDLDGAPVKASLARFLLA